MTQSINYIAICMNLSHHIEVIIISIFIMNLSSVKYENTMKKKKENEKQALPNLDFFLFIMRLYAYNSI